MIEFLFHLLLQKSLASPSYLSSSDYASFLLTVLVGTHLSPDASSESGIEAALRCISTAVDAFVTGAPRAAQLSDLICRCFAGLSAAVGCETVLTAVDECLSSIWVRYNRLHTHAVFLSASKISISSLLFFNPSLQDMGVLPLTEATVSFTKLFVDLLLLLRHL